MKRMKLVVTLLALALMQPAGGWAQAYPTKPVRVIVPFAPGTGLDLTVRVMSEKFQAATGQPLIVDNKGGAGGNIGTDAVAKAAPDGYTIGLIAINMLVINPYLYKDLPYDPVRDFAPIMHVTSTNHVLAVNPALPARDLREFVAWVKANPGKVSIATNGAGTTPHLLAVLLNQHTGTDVVPVHYKGGGEATKDFLGGHVQAIFNSPQSMLPQAAAGKARILAITRAKRSERLPDVPTFAELGYPDMTVDVWTAYMAPAGTPPAVVQKLYAEFARAIAAPDVVKRMEAEDYTLVASTPAETAQMIRTELKRWGGVVKASGWTVQ
jgi:tripartite-type tricarboxylate transporter receptor subunit TctC